MLQLVNISPAMKTKRVRDRWGYETEAQFVVVQYYDVTHNSQGTVERRVYEKYIEGRGYLRYIKWQGKEVFLQQ